MKKLLLTLAAICTATMTVRATETITGTQITNETVSTAFTDGAIISLQCLDTSGGVGTYFNGAATKTQAFSYANLFEVNVQSDGKFVLKKLITEEYVGCANTTFTGNAAVAMTSEIGNAAKFSAAIASVNNWTSKWSEVTNGTNTIRFTAHSGAHLNTNESHLVPKYSTGTGGFSVWFAYTYTPEEVAALAEQYVTTYFETNISNIRTLAQGYSVMKAVIGDEECPDVTLPEDVTPAAVAAIVTDGLAQYNAYINKFNNKWVTIYNNRRASGVPGYNANNPWLTLCVNSNGDAVINSVTAENRNDDSIWRMYVDDSTKKLRLYNRTSGYQLKGELLIPSAGVGGVRLLVDGTSNYIHLSGTTGDLMVYNVADDPGSVWTVAPASYTFCKPEVSTVDAPKYYRILSDRLMSNGVEPMLGIRGENREATGPGEQLSKYSLGAPGIYWRLEAVEGQDGACKFVNLMDDYEIGSTADANYPNKQNQVMAERGSGHAFYVINLENINMSNGNSFNIANSYALSSTPAIGNASCVDTDAAGLSRYNEWSPLRANKNNFGDNGSLWYFMCASDAEVEAATAKYVASVRSQLTMTDDTENLIALSDRHAVAEYKKILEELMPLADLSTKGELNAFKRQSLYKERLRTEVHNILDKYVVGQHVQFSATKTGWNTYYMKDAAVGDATRIKPTQSEDEFETIWLISKVENGYKLTNEATGRMIGFGQNADSSVWPTVANDADAQTFVLNYNPNMGKFTIRKEGTTEDNRRSIHLAGNNTDDNSIVKWSSNGLENSYWYISALAEPQVEVISNGQGGHCVRVSGEFTANANGDDKLITIYTLPETDEVRMMRAAPAEATVHAVYTVDAVRTSTEQTVAVDNAFEVGKAYFMEVPGAKLTTADGKHTRNLFTSFSVGTDGTVTGVKTVVAPAEPVAEVYYDLQGRRVANPGRGLYICNGRKVFIR